MDTLYTILSKQRPFLWNMVSILHSCGVSTSIGSTYLQEVGEKVFSYFVFIILKKIST